MFEKPLDEEDELKVHQTSKAHSSTKHPNPIAPPNIQGP
jgi:hypothetical protein